MYRTVGNTYRTIHTIHRYDTRYLPIHFFNVVRNLHVTNTDEEADRPEYEVYNFLVLKFTIIQYFLSDYLCV